jgi:hypothetical protein
VYRKHVDYLWSGHQPRDVPEAIVHDCEPSRFSCQVGAGGLAPGYARPTIMRVIVGVKRVKSADRRPDGRFVMGRGLEVEPSRQVCVLRGSCELERNTVVHVGTTLQSLYLACPRARWPVHSRAVVHVGTSTQSLFSVPPGTMAGPERALLYMSALRSLCLACPRARWPVPSTKLSGIPGVYIPNGLAPSRIGSRAWVLAESLFK